MTNTCFRLYASSIGTSVFFSICHLTLIELHVVQIMFYLFYFSLVKWFDVFCSYIAFKIWPSTIKHIFLESFPHLSFLCLFKCINIILCYAPLFLNLKIHRSVIFLYFLREDHDDVLSQDVCRNDGYH